MATWSQCWTKQRLQLSPYSAWKWHSEKKRRNLGSLESNAKITLYDWVCDIVDSTAQHTVFGFGISFFFFSSFYSKSKNILYRFVCAVHWLSHANIIKHKSIVIVRQTFDIIRLNAFWNLPLNFIDHVENRILSIERIFTNPEQSYVFAI